MSKLAGSAGSLKYYRPNEVAKMLRCSEWWVKEQARKRRIPYSWIGGSYLFTDEHILEIVKLFETRPVRVQVPAERIDHKVPSQAWREPPKTPAVLLKARPPRRSRVDGTQSAA